MHRAGFVGLVVAAILLAGCGGTSGGPTFQQAATVADSRLPNCASKRTGAPSVPVSSVDRQRLHITSDATLECGGAVIFHWYRFKDTSARQAFSATIGPIAQLQNPYLANGDVLVRVENARDVPSYAASLLPHLAADIKAKCGCGDVVHP